jgi:CBS domain-containing protein
MLVLFSGFSREERTMLCKDIMKQDIQSLKPEDSAREAARRMRAEGIGFLPVSTAHGMIVGALTDRDLALRIVADDKPTSTLVSDVMTKDVVFCHPGDNLRDAERTMADHQKSRIMVIDNGKLVGVISLSDIAEADSSRRAAETMRRVSDRETRIV